jgi:hypothetical protein
VSTLLQFRTAIAERIGVELSPTALNRLVNFALKEVATVDQWPWLTNSTTFTTVADQAAYTLGVTDVANIIQVSEVGGTVLDPLSLADADSYAYNASLPIAFGDGAYYALDGATIRIIPTPTDASTTIRVRYMRTEPTLVADGDTPLMPEALDQMVVELASYQALNRFPEKHLVEQAGRALDNYKRLLSGAKRTYLRRRGGPLTPRIRPGGGL